MAGLLSYDLRNIVRRAPGLTLCVNLLAGPVFVAWVWSAIVLGLPYSVTIGVMIAILVVGGFFACLMVEAFERHTWIVLVAQVLIVYFWFSSLVKLMRVVRGKDQFPDLAP